jgi:tetratricopeptide (TPR) repeat protein
LDSLGYAHHQLGHHAQAIDCFHHALRLFRAIDDRYDQADTLSHLGDSYDAAGDPGAAHDSWRQALTIFDDLDHADAHTVRAKLDRLDRTDGT